MKISLIVCIPTYKRARFLIDLLSSISNALSYFQETHNRDCLDLHIVVSDNDATSTVLQLIEARLPAITRQLTYTINSSNIGIERNILKAIQLGILGFGADKDTYIWAIGDDDIVSISSIHDIYTSICKLSHERPGLIICSENTGKQELQLISGVYASYSNALARFDEIYPQRPIHHTLMSLNVFRSDIYDSIMACDSLGTLYAQMYGLVHSKQFLDKPVVCLKGCQIILRTDTEGFHDKTLYQEVPFRWAEYYTKTRMLHLPYRSGKILKAALRSDYWKS